MALTKVSTDGVKDDAVTLAKQAAGTDGQIITYDASGNPVAVGPGTDGQVLTSTGAGSPPAFETPAPGVGGATGVDFNDDVKARFGTGNDLEIYHSGSHSHITDAGTGGLKIRGSQVIIDDAAGDVMIQADQDGSVDLYYDGSNVCETITNGIKLTDTELTEASDNFSINIQSGNNDFYVKSGGTTFAAFKGSAKDLQLTSGNLVIGTSGKGISFTGQTATSASGTSNQDTDEIINAYEFGDWTPTCTNTALSSGGGHYSKIGHFVYISCNMTFASMSGGGTVTLGGLPFATGSGTFGGIMVKYSNFSNLGDIMGHLDAGAATLHLPGTTLDEASGKRLDWSTVYTTYDF